MSMALGKKIFPDILADKNNKVIALSGKWGSGKSYLWREIQASTTDESLKKAVYVSLFGIRSINELKLKIIQALIPHLESGGPAAQMLRTTVSAGKKILKGFHPGFSALDEFALLAVPVVFKNRFIVIDDIERKHEQLSIDEILGFIDDCVQNDNARILLILNSDQLADKTLWELFREKVIDQELRLDTTPSEAFAIASALTPSPHAAAIGAAVEVCQVTNIRTARRIIRVVNTILADHQELALDVLERVIPSTVLLSAINYKSLEDGPDFEFVLRFDSTYRAMQLVERKKKDTPETVESKLKARWALLMDKLQIRSTDEFETLVVDYLKSGLIAADEIRKVIDRYVAETNTLAARARTDDFFERSVWRPDISDTEQLNDLRALVADAALLDMFTVTSLHRQASELPEGEPVGRQLLNGWLAAFRQQPHDEKSFQDFNFWRKPLHPDILAEVDAIRARHQSQVTLLEVCRKVREDHGWGPKEQAFMKSVSSAQYKAAIKNHTGRELKLLLLQSMDFCRDRAGYEPHFGPAIQSFLDACKELCQENENPRLIRLITTLFTDAGLSAQITPQTLAPGAAAEAVVVPNLEE